MKKILFTFYFLLFTFYLFSQINILYNDGYNEIVSDIDKYDNTYYISCSYNNIGDRIKNIDENGNLLQEIILYNGGYQQRATLNSIITKENKLYFLTKEEIYGDTTKYFFSFTCFTLDFDTIWTKKYFVDTTLIFSNNFCETIDGGFAIAGNIDKGNYIYDAFILKIDSLGNEQWYKEYGGSKSETITNILQTQDGGYIISGSTENSYGYSRWYIIRTDSMGNQIWDWVLPNPYDNLISDMAVADLIQTQDGNFVAVGGQTYNCSGHCLVNARLLKFDINKNVLLDTLYYEKYEDEGVEDSTTSYFSQIKQLNNGDFLLIGHKQSLSGDFWAYTPILYKFDNNFNILTKRNYKSLPYGWGAEYIRDFIVEQDGSLTMIGDINANGAISPNQQVWFVRTDTNYCDGFGSCDTLKGIDFLIPDTISKTDTISLTFKINSNFNIDYDIRFIFYSTNKYMHILDTVVYNIHANNIDNSFLISYNLLLQNEYYYYHNGNDTIYLFYSLYPSDSLSCGKFNSYLSDNYIIFSEPDSSIYVPQIEKVKESLQIYPNPATNNIQLVISNKQLNKNTSVYIYDIYGKEIKHETIDIKHNTININISNLEKGVYFVRVGSAVGKFVKE